MDHAITTTGGDERRPTVAEQALMTSLDGLVGLRWLAGIGVLLAGVVAARILGMPVREVPFYGTAFFVLASNAALRRWLDRLRARPSAGVESYALFARVQIGLDWLGMTFVTACTGGIESPALAFFLIHIAIAALLLPHRRAFVYVAVAPLLVTFEAALEYYGVIPHVALFGSSRHRDPVYAGSVLLFFTCACYLLAYLCVAITRRLRRREQEIDGLYESVRETTSTLDLQTVLNRLVESATRVLGCKGAAIRMLDPGKKQVAFAATFGLSDEYVGNVPQDFTTARLDQATLAGEPLFVNDAAEDPRIWNRTGVRREGIGSMLSVALPGKAGPLGVLRVYGGGGHKFSDEDAAFLELVAGHGAVAIENAQAYRMLEDLDREKSRFVRIATHELRAPIGVTESLLTTLAGGYVGELAPEHLAVVERAMRRVQALQVLVNDLLDLASGKVEMTIEKRRTAIGAIVAEVCDRLQPRAAAKRIALAFVRTGDEMEMMADPADLDRLVTNLVGNAVKYTPAGRVEVTLSRDGDRAAIVVADTGIGIPADSLPKLFQEFYRARNAKAVDEAGTGLGLTIIKDLVERYGGTIGVESEEGKGTRFTVTLPLVSPVVRAPA